MTFVGLALCIALIFFSTVNVVGSLLAVLLLGRVGCPGAPGRRARRIMLLRLLPAASSTLFVTVLILPAYLLLEPRDTSERVSLAMLGLAAASSLIVAGPLRAIRSMAATRGLLGRWRRGAKTARISGLPIPAWVIEEALPVVTVVGALRPRLYISRKVLEECSEGELTAIIRHEIGHLKNRDNWKRLLFATLPDWLALTPWAERIERAWSEAAEDVADDHAARGSSSGDLASALLKVARMTPPASAAVLPASALYRGAGLDRRIRRLLEAPADRYEVRSDAFLLVIGSFLLAGAFTLGLQADLLQRLHAVTEVVVGRLQ